MVCIYKELCTFPVFNVLTLIQLYSNIKINLVEVNYTEY